MNDELYLKQVGKRVMEKRKMLGMTQEELAEKSGLTTQYISYVEGGKRNFRVESAIRLSNALEMSVDYLLTGFAIDKDKLLLSEKLGMLSSKQRMIVENIIDECIALFNGNE